MTLTVWSPERFFSSRSSARPACVSFFQPEGHGQLPHLLYELEGVAPLVLADGVPQDAAK